MWCRDSGGPTSEDRERREGPSGCERALLIVFLLTLPLVNPWVRGDGVGYYAYARSLLIDGDLNFENEWRAANASFRLAVLDENGQVRPEAYTATGRVSNHFTVGPAMLWAPFLVAAHIAVLALNRLGVEIAADGYSRPYTVTMAVATAFYGFCGLWLAFRLARKYFPERWALLATLEVWFASSLPVYMYFNPSWSHAHSAFAVALFLWYWDHTRGRRTLRQWVLLGLMGGLMINVYYPNAVALAAPALESGAALLGAVRLGQRARVKTWAARAVLFAAVAAAAFAPTFVTRWLIYGSPFGSGYPELAAWHWTSPRLWDVLFSSNHGLLSWTPVLVPALLGLWWVLRRDPVLGAVAVSMFLALYYLIASYDSWHGISSFGNWFFVSLTSVFVLGLAALLSRLQQWRPAGRGAAAALGVLALWNLGLIYQWGTNLIPNRGEISWRQAAANQLAVVPAHAATTLRAYLRSHGDLMERLEEEDIREMTNGGQPSTDGR
jgi:hypothetical protein